MLAEEQRSPLPGISRNVFLLSLVSLFTDISSEMLYPLVPMFLTATLGVAPSVVGIIEGAAEMTASLLKAFSGWWSDQVGRRLPFVISGYALSAVSKPVLALAYAWPMVLVARVSDRFGKGLRGTARDAILAESSTASMRGRAFGFHRSADQLGAVIGPLLAVPLLGFFAGNHRPIFLVAFLPGAISTALLLLVRETGRKATGSAPPPNFRWSETTPAFRKFLFVTLLFAIGNSSDVFLLLRARQLGIAESAIFVLYALYNGVTVAAAWPAGIVSDRIGRLAMLTTGFALFAAIYSGFAMAASARAIWWLFAAYGLYSALTEGIARAFAVDLAGKEHRGTALGLHALATGITTFAASSIAGWLWTKRGAPAAFYYGAITAALSAVLLPMLVPVRYNHE